MMQGVRPWSGLVLALLLSLLAGCAQQAKVPTNCALVPLATLPLHVEDGLLVVHAGIAGQQVRLVVDTGAEGTLLTQAAVQRLHLPLDSHHTVSAGVGGFSDHSDARVPGIVLGGTRFPVEHVAVGDFALPHLSGGRIDGLLGADILLAFEVDLDVPDRQVTLYRVRHCALDLPPWPATEIDGVQARRDRMLVPITVDGVHGMAVLDTGSQNSAISWDMAERAGVTGPMLAQDETLSVQGVAPRPVLVPMQRFRSMTIGSEPVLYPRLAVLHDVSGMGDGLVGADFLRGRRVWIAFPSLHLFIARPAAP